MRHTKVMRFLPLVLAVGVLVAVPIPGFSQGSDWPDWRGPTRDGRSPEKNLPESWSPDGENLLWRVPYGGRSAPVVHGNRLYLQNGSGEGSELQERVLCFNADTGELIWEYKFNIFLSDVPPHRVGWASPVVDRETGNIFVNGVGGTLRALSPAGKLLWMRSLNEDFGLITTHGGRTVAPIVEGDLVIISGPASAWGSLGRGGQKFFAFDKKDGSTVWVKQFPGRPYDTVYSPPVAADINGVRHIFSGGSDGAVHAYKPQTGEHVWRYGMSKRGINTGTVILGDKAYVSHGEENLSGSEMGQIAVIDVTARGELDENNVQWKRHTFLAGYSSPVTDGERIYQVDNSANLAAIDPKTGKELWRLNLGTIQRASPVLADGKIYVGAQNGRFFIIRPGKDGGEILDQDWLGGEENPEAIIASAAVSRGRIFVVSNQALYAIGRKGKTAEPVLQPANSAVSNRAPASVQVVPTELVLKPGDSVQFKVKLFDDRGAFIRETEAAWSLEKLEGSVSADGAFVSGGSKPQAGLVKATVGELSGAARVRVIPPPPIRDDFESYPAGGPGPAYWINAGPAKYQLRELDGNKVMVKKADNPFTFVRRVRTHMGDSSWSDYTIAVDVRGARRRRRMGDAGIIAQRYKLVLFGNNRRITLNPWQPETQRAVSVPFIWEPDVWYRMKLRVENLPDGKVLIRAKVWKKEAGEPNTWLIEHMDPRGNRQGSPGLYVDAYSEVFFDNLSIIPNGGALTHE